MLAATPLQHFPKVHNPFRLGKSPRQVGRLRSVIVNLRVRTELPEPACGKDCCRVRDQSRCDTSPPELRFDPNTFEKCDRPRIAAVGVFPHRNFRKTDSGAVSRLRNKAPSVSTAQHFINHLGVFSGGFICPKGDPHFHPDRPVVRTHLPDCEFHTGDRTMGRGLKVGDPTHARSSSRHAGSYRRIGRVSAGEKTARGWEEETRVLVRNILSVR
jgi:hypothetical protein